MDIAVDADGGNTADRTVAGHNNNGSSKSTHTRDLTHPVLSIQDTCNNKKNIEECVKL